MPLMRENSTAGQITCRQLSVTKRRAHRVVVLILDLWELGRRSSILSLPRRRCCHPHYIHPVVVVAEEVSPGPIGVGLQLCFAFENDSHRRNVRHSSLTDDRRAAETSQQFVVSLQFRALRHKGCPARQGECGVGGGTAKRASVLRFATISPHRYLLM